MGFISKVQIAVSMFRRSGISGVIRRVCESIRMRWRMKCWYGPRGRLLNYWKSWRTDRPILVIESDDWGAEHIPGPDAVRTAEIEKISFSGSHSSFDGLETADDVDRLCDVLSAHRNADGDSAVLTANFVMANPDFEAVKQSGYSVFKARTIDKGFNHEADGTRLWKSYRNGIESGLLVPQFHGLLHFCPDEWLERLRQGDAGTLKAFDLQMVGEDLTSSGIGIQSMAPIYYTSAESIQHFVKEGVKIFKQIFNMNSLTTIAPCYAWKSPETEQALLPEGILAMQGKEYQCLPNGSTRLHYLGQLGPGGILYMVRSCKLEPLAAGTSVDKCFTQVRNAFARNIPAVLCSHRFNYTSRVDTKVRDKGLAVLDGVLKRVTQVYPNVEFLSSDKLALRILKES